MRPVLAIIRAVIGGIFGILSVTALSPALAAITPTGGGGSAPLLTAAIALVGVAIGLFAPTLRRAFGRGFLMSGASLLALPLSTAALSGQAASQVISDTSVNDQAFVAVGAGLGAAALTGAAMFVGLILGAIFIITGLVLVLGGRREVIVVESRVAGLRR